MIFYSRSGREYENLIMDCCQLEDGVTGVKREDAAGNDPENGSPDADRGGECTKATAAKDIDYRYVDE